MEELGIETGRKTSGKSDAHKTHANKGSDNVHAKTDVDVDYWPDDWSDDD